MTYSEEYIRGNLVEDVTYIDQKEVYKTKQHFSRDFWETVIKNQKLVNELRRTHEFYLESKNGECAGITHQILGLSSYGGTPKKEWLETKEGTS